MSTPAETRDTILAEIATHLKVHGPKDWHLIRDRYPDLIGKDAGTAGDRKFYRWVDKVRTNPVAGTFANAAKEVRGGVGRHLPVAPPPEYLVRGGARAVKNIDFLSVLGDVYADIELMRDYASKFEDGKRAIKNPVYFDTAIKRRLDLLQTGLNLTREIWDLQAMEDFYAEVISIIADEIAPAEPEIVRRVMLRLQALNDRRGMTQHAGVDG